MVPPYAFAIWRRYLGFNVKHRSGKKLDYFEIKLSRAVEAPVRYEALQQYFPPRGPGNPQLLDQKVASEGVGASEASRALIFLEASRKQTQLSEASSPGKNTASANKIGEATSSGWPGC